MKICWLFWHLINFISYYFLEEVTNIELFESSFSITTQAGTLNLFSVNFLFNMIASLRRKCWPFKFNFIFLCIYAQKHFRGWNIASSFILLSIHSYVGKYLNRISKINKFRRHLCPWHIVSCLRFYFLCRANKQ